MKIYIGASREQLRRIATELLTACDNEQKALVDVEIDGHVNSIPLTQLAVVSFSNDDMEDNPDVPKDAVLIDVDR